MITQEISPGFRKKLEGFCQGSGGGVVKWDLSDLTNPPILWLDASTTDWKTGNSQEYLTFNTSPDPDTVSLWEDRSTSSNNAEQTIEANQPTTATSGMGGQRGVSFNGSNNFMETINNIGITGNSDRSIFVVVEAVNPASSQYFVSMGENTTGKAWNLFTNTSTRLGFNVSAGNEQWTWLDNENIISTIADGVLTQSDVNIFEYDIPPILTSTNDRTINTTDSKVSIGRFIGAANYFAKYVLEVIILDVAVTEAQRNKIFGYLSHKYGKTENLAIDHPYKSTFPTV